MSLKSALKSLDQAQAEHDQRLRDHYLDKEGAERRLEDAAEEARQKFESGEMGSAELGIEKRALQDGDTQIKAFRRTRFSLGRGVAMGWGAGLYWVAFAADFQLGALGAPTLARLAWPIGIFLFALFAFRVIGKIARTVGSTKFALVARRVHDGWASEVFSGGSGMFLVMGAAFALAWSHALLGTFLKALAIETLFLWLWALPMFVVAVIDSWSHTHKNASRESEAWARGAPDAKNPEDKKLFARMIGLSTSHRHRLLSRALAVALPLFATPVWCSVASRSNDFSLHPVEASALGFENPTEAQSVAQTLKARAQEALVAGQKTGQGVGSDWLQSMATANALPGGAQVGWAASPQAGVRVTLTMPAFYKGVYRPAGLWVVDYRPVLREEQYALPQGVWFIPFYGNAGCNSVIPDVKALDAEWLRQNTSGADRYQSGFAYNSTQPYTDFAAANQGRQVNVECVGNPIALKSPMPRELARDPSGSNQLVTWLNVDDRERAMGSRMKVLQLFGDWADYRAWRANGESIGQALSAKLNKIMLTYENWKKPE